MAHTVRIFGLAGIVPLQVVDSKMQVQSSILQLKQPYLWRQQLVADAVAAASVAAAIPAGYSNDPTTILRIEIADGFAIRYEVNPPGRNVSADANSPFLTGLDQIEFGPGWLLSIIDAAST